MRSPLPASLLLCLTAVSCHAPPASLSETPQKPDGARLVTTALATTPLPGGSSLPVLSVLWGMACAAQRDAAEALRHYAVEIHRSDPERQASSRGRPASDPLDRHQFLDLGMVSLVFTRREMVLVGLPGSFFICDTLELVY